jgi:hypothetical protein
MSRQKLIEQVPTDLMNHITIETEQEGLVSRDSTVRFGLTREGLFHIVRL